MKALLPFAIIAAFQIGTAEEEAVEVRTLPEDAVLIVVRPEKSKVARNEQIDVEVFIRNSYGEAIEVPPSVTKDGYSSTIVDFDVRTFRIEGDQLEPQSEGVASSGLTCLPYRSLEPWKSKRYKFRWTCPDENFDLLSLKVRFFIEGRFRSGETTLTQKRQQGVAPQSATRSESNLEGGDKPQPESEGRSR